MGMIEIIQDILTKCDDIPKNDPRSEEILESYLKTLGLKIVHIDRTEEVASNTTIGIEASMRG